MPPKNLILIFSNSEQMFGEVLSKEQLPLINSYTQNGLQFIQEMREFMKERSAIEREYSQRLEALAKRHLKQKDRIGSLITVQGELPASESGDSRKPTAVSYGSMFGAWESLLQQTEEIAKTRLAMSDKLITAVSDQFKGLAIRVDESRRKHVAFSAKLNESRDKAYADKDRNKERYDQSCEAVEASKQRLEKCADEKAQEKFRKQLEQDTEEMNNVKNSYLMSISVANAFKKRFYYQDVPKLMNDMQQLNHRLVKTTQRLWEQFATYELTALSKVQDHVNSILLVVREIDAVADTDSFARMHAKPWTEPYDFAFEPTLLWKDSDELVSDQASKICLNNKLGKIDEKLAEIDKEIVGKTKEIDGLRKLLNAYTENPAMGDAEEINENIIEAQRALATLELNRLRYMTSIAVITKVIGDADVGQRHNLVRASFTIPVSCDYCQEKIWGMTKTGFSCKDCGYNCHAKCELKVPPQCSKAKPKEYRKTIVVELTPTSQSFDRSPSASMRSVNSAAPPAKPPPITGSNLKLNSSLAKETKNSSTSSLGSANVANSISNSKSSRALYSYQALNMDELTIKEGDVINVISDEGDGWVMAELNGKKGVVPMSYLSTSDAGPAKGSSNMRSRSSLSHPNIERKELVRVLFDYDAQSDVEISIKKGDIIEVTNRYEEGWWEGVLNGKQGEFPCTYVEPYDGNYRRRIPPINVATTVTPKMNGGLVLTNQKRTRVLFDPDLSLPPEEDESAVRMKLKMKMRSEYANALELPPAIIQKEQTAREKRLREQIEQQQQKLKAEFELVASDDKQSFEQVTIEELVEEDTKAIRAASSSAGAMSSGKELVLLGDQKGGMQMMARTVKPGESFDSATSRAALIRTQLVHQTPKPTWHAPWKLMRVISGHLGWVRCVAVDVSNQWFATGAADRVIKIWDMASGTLKLSLTGHISTVRGLVSSPRHPYLFSCGEDKQIKCWDLETNKVIRHYHGHLSAVYSMALHPTLDVLITGGRDSVARVWDMRTRQSIHVLSGHTQTVSSILTQEADPQVITSSMDSTVRLWDLAAGKTMATLTHHKKSVRALVANPNEFTFASASPENIKQWKCPEAKFIQNLSGHRSIVNTMACNADNVLVSGGDNGSLYFWDWKSGYNFQKMETIVQPGSLDSEAGIFCSTFDRSGSRLITGEADKTIKIWCEDETATAETHPIVGWKPSLKKDHY